ncbi:pleiotropic drug resistance protein 3-like [Prunus yedoensis var. nudiflora]|uniref:Pleiotropic drug resistance protein 3-like n=1 Tax=Prunus yedoensis var. nudiflora TaxID=2094558 RepID=A0A314UKM1_PRUYE|nr:pleiotropic drug resistance protein 3-like [Prunus yedoensis var. nudiflora]
MDISLCFAGCFGLNPNKPSNQAMKGQGENRKPKKLFCSSQGRLFFAHFTADHELSCGLMILRYGLCCGAGEDENEADGEGKRVVDVTKLRALERHLFIEKLIKHIENDNLRLLRKIRNRIDRVGVELPTVEVRYKDLCVEAVCEVVHGKPLPTLWNSVKSMLSVFAKFPGSKSREAKISIIKDFRGTIKPGRMWEDLLFKGAIRESGQIPQVVRRSYLQWTQTREFVPQKTSAYISQLDMHIPEMTVRETLDFSARCQGIGSRADFMLEVSKREKEAGIIPDPDVDTYMKAISVQGLKRTLQTDYILKILGLDICADTLVGDP